MSTPIASKINPPRSNRAWLGLSLVAVLIAALSPFLSSSCAAQRAEYSTHNSKHAKTHRVFACPRCAQEHAASTEYSSHAVTRAALRGRCCCKPDNSDSALIAAQRQTPSERFHLWAFVPVSSPPLFAPQIIARRFTPSGNGPPLHRTALSIAPRAPPSL